MAKIRLVSDATWRVFEKKRSESSMSEEEYLCHLMSDQPGKEVEGALKDQMESAINEMGKAKDANKQLAEQITELVAKNTELELELDEYQTRIDEQKAFIEKSEKDYKKDLASVTKAAKKKISELEDKISKYPAFATLQQENEKLLATIDDLSKELALCKEQLSEKEEELTLDEAEEILKDE